MEPHVRVPDADGLRGLLLSGGPGLTVRQSRGKGEIGDPPSSGRSLPRASLPGRWPCVRLAQGQSRGARAPAQDSRGPCSSAPARVPGRPLPAPCLSPARPGSVPGRSDTSPAAESTTPARERTQGGGRALSGPVGAVEGRGPGSGLGVRGARRRSWGGRGRRDPGAGGNHRSARGAREGTCAEVGRGRGAGREPQARASEPQPGCELTLKARRQPSRGRRSVGSQTRPARRGLRLRTRCADLGPRGPAPGPRSQSPGPQLGPAHVPPTRAPPGLRLPRLSAGSRPRPGSASSPGAWAAGQRASRASRLDAVGSAAPVGAQTLGPVGPKERQP